MHQFLNYLYSNGGQVIDPDTNTITLNSSNTVEALAFYGKLANVAQEGPLAYERSQLRDLLNDKKKQLYFQVPNLPCKKCAVIFKPFCCRFMIGVMEFYKFPK